ncbi:hypothetical protein ACRCJR_06065 [Aerococcus urinaeequi]|uniref:hypothetical protein n=1 Tax=Aerococcus urinaeequi TaxID=51665 RepID=UPI003D6B66B0
MNMSLFLSVILSFVLFYNPPIVSINTIVLGGLISFIYNFFNFKKIINNKKIIDVIVMQFLYTIIFVYLFIIIVLNSQSINNLAFIIYIILFVFSICVSISIIFIKNKLDIKQVLNIFLITGSIQGFISIVSLLFPNIQSLIIERIVSLGYSSVWLKITDHRLFGYSDSLTFSMPIVQSFLAIVSFYMYLRFDRKYILFTPLLVLSAIINARTSIVIIVIGFLLIIFEFKNVFKNNFLKSIFSLFLITGIFYVVSILLSRIFPEIYQWAAEGLELIFRFLKGDNSEGYFSYITDPKVYRLPEDIIGKLFGRGHRIMEISSINSDVGFINDTWLGGFIYVVIIYTITMNLLINIKKNINEFLSSFIVKFLVLTLFVSNFKGTIIGLNGIYSLIILLFIYSKLSSDTSH